MEYFKDNDFFEKMEKVQFLSWMRQGQADIILHMME